MSLRAPTPQLCPICGTEVSPFPRYPNYVCRHCIKNHGMLSAEGEHVEFFNVDFSGGCYGVYKGTERRYESRICYVKGVKCFADEARFGGIVVQPHKPGTWPYY